MPVSPTTEQIEASLRWWVALGSGLTPSMVQPANSGQPAPNEDYATLLMVRDSQPGKPVQRRVIGNDGDVDETTIAVVRGRYSVQWYRDGAADRASQFRVWVYSTRGRHAALTGLTPYPGPESYHGIGGDFAPFTMMRLTGPQRIDAIISDAEEPRYTATLDIQYVQTVDATIQRFVETDIILSDGIGPEHLISIMEELPA